MRRHIRRRLVRVGRCSNGRRGRNSASQTVMLSSRPPAQSPTVLIVCALRTGSGMPLQGTVRLFVRIWRIRIRRKGANRFRIWSVGVGCRSLGFRWCVVWNVVWSLIEIRMRWLCSWGSVRVRSRLFGRIRRRSGGISAVISIARSSHTSHTSILQARKQPKTNAHAKPATDGTQPL
jgi:hypothetical protein